MAKFSVNQKVLRAVDGKEGIIRAREVTHSEDRKNTSVRYLVDFGEGIDKWRVMNKKGLISVPKKEESPYKFKMYGLSDGKVLTMAAKIDVVKGKYLEYDDDDFCPFNVIPYTAKCKFLNIGFSIYNGSDEYNSALGQKYAAHRCKSNPFTRMYSSFSGEFNEQTVEAIMDAKAKYIIENINNFYRPA